MSITPWPVVRLGSLLIDVQPGFASGRHNSDGDGVPQLRPMNVNTDGRIDRNKLLYVPFDPSKVSYRLRPGDILFNNTNSPELVGKTALFQETDAPAFSNHMTRLRVDTSQADPLYIALRLHLAWRQGWFQNHCNNHVSQASISREVLQSFEIDLPPLEIQHEISHLCNLVDKHRLAASRNLAASQRAIERLRQAALAEAYSSLMDECLDRPTVPLRELLSEPLKNGYSARPVAHTTPFKVLTLTATTSGIFDPRHFKYTDKAFSDDSPFWVEPGDVLVQRGNTAEYVGIPALYQGASRQFIYPDLMIRVRVRSDINPRFIWYMLLAPQVRRFLREHATGSAGNMPKINQLILGEVPIPVSMVETRDALVARLDTTLVLAARIEGLISTAARHLAGASFSVISKAMRGDLEGSAV